MNKLLIICGPTAIGKTQIGIKLAKKFDGEIVSADSRQVYKSMDIATGKDLAAYGNTPTHMLDVVEPTEDFSVAQYSRLARKALNDIWSRGKLPILVGGTGLYIKALVDGIGTLHVPPNTKLRKKHTDKTADELFDVLRDISPEKAESMNVSDRKNPRRLIRAIEVARWKWEVRDENVESEVGSEMDILMLGLAAHPGILNKKITERVDRWVKNGTENEVKKLIKSGVSWDAQSMNAIGYRQWKPYFAGSVGIDEVITEWKKDEWQYAKRQMTWFKRDKRIIWFNIEDLNWVQNVEKKVRAWYN